MGSVVATDQDPGLPVKSEPQTIVFSYEGWHGETAYSLIRGMGEGEVGVLCAKEFGEQAMIRYLEVTVDRDLRSFCIAIDLQRTKWGNNLLDSTIRNETSRCFAENFEVAVLSARNKEMDPASVVNLVPDLTSINQYIEAFGDVERHVRHLLILNIEVVGGVLKIDIDPFVRAVFGSIEDLATFIQRSKIAISKEMPTETILIDLATKPLPQATGT